MPCWAEGGVELCVVRVERAERPCGKKCQACCRNDPTEPFTSLRAIAMANPFVTGLPSSTWASGVRLRRPAVPTLSRRPGDPLRDIIMRGDAAALRVLHEGPKGPVDLDQPWSARWNALSIKVARDGHAELLDYMLSQGSCRDRGRKRSRDPRFSVSHSIPSFSPACVPAAHDPHFRARASPRAPRRRHPRADVLRRRADDVSGVDRAHRRDGGAPRTRL